MKIFTGLLCVFLLGLPIATSAEKVTTPPPPSVNVSTSTDGNNVTITIDPSNLAAGTKMRDIHFTAAGGCTFPKLGGNGGSTQPADAQGGGDAQTWNRNRSGDGRRLSFSTGTSSSSPAGYCGTFVITVQLSGSGNDNWTQNPVTWKATSDGTASGTTAGTICTSAGTQAPNFPQFCVACADGDTMKVLCGTSTSIPIATVPGFAGYAYQIFTSDWLANEGDSTDTLGIGIGYPKHAVPAEWGLTFTNFEGYINLEGTSDPLPVISVPDNTDLRGNVFYLVLAITEGGEPIAASSPIAVEIK
jgi:hypothetical protein